MFFFLPGIGIYGNWKQKDGNRLAKVTKTQDLPEGGFSAVVCTEQFLFLGAKN